MPGTTGDLARNRFGLPVGPGQSTRRPQGQDIGHGQLPWPGGQEHRGQNIRRKEAWVNEGGMPTASHSYDSYHESDYSSGILWSLRFCWLDTEILSALSALRVNRRDLETARPVENRF